MPDEHCHPPCLVLTFKTGSPPFLVSGLNQAVEEKVTFNRGNQWNYKWLFARSMAARKEQYPTPCLMRRGSDAMCLVFECRLNHVLYLAGMCRMGGEPVLKIPIA